MKVLGLWIACALTVLTAGIAHAEEASAGPEIVVTAPPPPRIAPERTLDASALAAYGRDSVAELIADIAAEDGDTAEEPAFLINGRRVPGLGTAANLPAEAVLKIDILPAGSGVKVGATSRQRVYDIQLRRELDLTAASASLRRPTSGGWSSRRAELSHTHIRSERRINVAAKLREESLLLESERAIIQPAGTLPGAGGYRSLVPATDRIELSLSAADALAPWLTGSINSTLSVSHRHALLGPFVRAGIAEQPLDQKSQTRFATTDLVLNAQASRWQIGLFGNHTYRRGRNFTESDSAGAASPLLATIRSVTASLGARLSAFGPLVDLPAGPVTANLGAGVTRDRVEGRSGPLFIRNRTTLSTESLSAAIDLPIASRSADVLAAIGDLSASAEFARQHVSDFGRFDSYTLSLLWRPNSRVGVNGSISRNDSAPPVGSLDEPVIETPGTRYFDPLRGETVDVTLLSGGIAGLGRQSERSRRVAVNVTPFRTLGLRLDGEYFDRRSRNGISELPLASLSILQAFPERFIRDASGRLIRVDARPIAFAARSERQLRAGFVLNLPLGRPMKGGGLADDDEAEARARPARGGVRPRLQVSAAYTRLLESQLTLRTGQQPINLLSADAVGFGGLGQPRHRFDASLGYAESGMGIRTALQMRGASMLEASGSAVNILRFQPLTTFTLRAWVGGERLAPRSRWMKGTRLSLALLNATNARERVIDRLGFTPLSYQPGYRDPVGRSFELQFRKKF